MLQALIAFFAQQWEAKLGKTKIDRPLLKGIENELAQPKAFLPTEESGAKDRGAGSLATDLPITEKTDTEIKPTGAAKSPADKAESALQIQPKITDKSVLTGILNELNRDNEHQ